MDLQESLVMNKHKYINIAKDFFTSVFKMAAKADMGTFFGGSNPEIIPWTLFYDSTKFHAFMTKCIIL